MARFDHLKGVFGLLPTPYQEDYEIHIPDLRAAANFCCTSGQHGIVWPVMVGGTFAGSSVVVLHVGPVVDAIPSLTTAYHSYSVLLLKFGQVTLAVPPEGTVSVPIN